MTSLTWNETHTLNNQHTYCYCGKDRNLLDISLQCKGCRNWFHTHCTQVTHPPDLLFTTNYTFVCKHCSDTHQESFERTTAGWKDICSTAIANLLLQDLLAHLGTDRILLDSQNAHTIAQWYPEQYYNKKEIIPYVDKHWQSLCTERARTTTWWATLGSCLYSSKESFIARDERQRSAASDFCLVDWNLWHIRPVQPTTPRLTKQRMRSESEVPIEDKSCTPSPPSSPITTVINTVPSVFTAGSTDHPCNRFGFKYTPCEPSSFAPMMYQQATHAHGTAVSITDKSSYVSVAKDGFTVTTDRGYRMCRANVGVQEGNWYWEAVVQKASNTPEGPHVRLGWARREACLNGPVGYDGYGYAYRDLTGDKVFCSRPTAFGASFEAGDVIGLYISLPPKSTVKSLTRKRIPIVYKDHLWFEEKDFRPSKEYQALADLPYPLRDAQHLNVIPGSYITVYKNGVCQGKMFEDLLDYEDFGSLPSMIQAGRKKRRKKQKKDKDVTGIRMRLEEDAFDGVRAQQWTEDPPLEDDGTLGYYPAVSVFQGGMVTCQFGPEFRYPPSPGEPWKPMSQRYDEYMAEECLWDVMDEVLRSLRRV